jgi:hypothetical protein
VAKDGDCRGIILLNVKDELAQKAAYSKLTCENARNTTNKFVPKKKLADKMNLPR